MKKEEKEDNILLPPASYINKMSPATTTKGTVTIKSDKKEVKTNTHNPYNLTSKQTQHKGGFLTAKFSGENQLEQFDKIAKILQIPTTNDFVAHKFHGSNSWLTTHFHNQKDLYAYVKAMENLKDDNIKLIDLSRKERYKSEENNNDRHYQSDNNINNQSETERKKETNNKFWQNKQNYILTDIPLNCNRNKIKGALKPFGKILEL